MRFLIFLMAWTLLSPWAGAQTPSQVSRLSEILNDHAALTLPIDRARPLSRTFVGLPYLDHGPLGEGPEGRFDQDPLYRFDGFDCTTYLETVIALTRSRSIQEFELHLQNIRYRQGQIQYQDRNHFVELDWNPNNQRAGYVFDLTHELALPAEIQVVSQVFSKRGWYRSKKMSELRVQGLSPTELQSRWQEWVQLGDAFLDQKSELKILPALTLLKVKSLPEMGVLNVVRNVSGTQMVTHQALLILDSDSNGTLTYRVRHASSKYKKVVDQSLREFVQGQSQSSGFLGFNVLRVLP